MTRRHSIVTIVEDAAGYAVERDGRILRSPGGRAVILPTLNLATAVASEWRAQGRTIDPATMPLSRFAMTAIDLVAPRRDDAIVDFANYADGDLICYRAAAPPELVALQAERCEPLIAWAARALGAELTVTHGVMPITQSAVAKRQIAAQLARYDEFQLAALATLVPAIGSLIVGLALAEGALDVAEATALGALEENFQATRWGVDEDASARRRGVADDIAAAAAFLNLLR